MFKKLIELYEEWKFNKEFEKKKAEILKTDPFIYEFPWTEKEYYDDVVRQVDEITRNGNQNGKI